jgi:type I restriction enzyme S subunit
MPMDIDEQLAIATAITDIDSYLSALEFRQAKVHEIKQGMMQDLLTGRTRLL